MTMDVVERQLLFQTRRLRVYVATPEDAVMFFDLWTNPRVMGNVGFPQGLPITYEEIVKQLGDQAGQILDARLVVKVLDTGCSIGECKLGRPNEQGISTTDVKLLPEYWGQKYGVEIKQALLEYLFTHTLCTVVEATPNVKNIASIKMQEAVGGERVGEITFNFPESMHSFTTPVHAFVYQVRRENWVQA